MGRIDVLCAALLIGLAVVAVLGYPWPDVAHAQESYTVGPASAAQVVTLTTVIGKLNGDTCARYQLARTCTQAQVCAAAGAAGGSGCTAPQARVSNVRIWPNTTASERTEFVTNALVLPAFAAQVAQANDENRRAFCAAFTAATNSVKDQICTGLALPTGWVAATGLGCSPGC